MVENGFERIMEIDLIFDKIHPNLSNKDKLSLQHATYGNRNIQRNFVRVNSKKKRIICPACLIDFTSNDIPWVPNKLTQPNHIGTMKLPLGNLLIRSNIEEWSKISPLANPDKEEKVIRLTKYSEALDFIIPGTQSTVNRVNLVEAETLFQKNYGNQKFEEFESTAAFMKHFHMCHAANGKTPKPKRKLCLTRENNRLVYKAWPVYDLPLKTSFYDYVRMNHSKFYPLKTLTEEVKNYHKDYNVAKLSRVIRNLAFTDYIAFFANTPALQFRNHNNNSQYLNVLYSLTILCQIYEHVALVRGRYPSNLSNEVQKSYAHFMLLSAFTTRHLFSLIRKNIRDI